MRNVFLSVPTRGQIQWQTVTRLEQIRDENQGLPPILYQPGNLSVALTRNRIVKQFLASSCDTLIMVDDDVVPPPHLLESLLPIADGFGMVAVPHSMPSPSDPGRLVLTSFQETRDGLVGCDLAFGLNEVAAVATGCVAISRAALVSLGANPFRIENDPDAVITSDDFLFCADLRKAGFKIGCWWDGWYADHLSTVSLAPIFELQSREMSPLAGRRKE